MNITWFLCNRSIGVIESLADDLKIDFWGSGMSQKIDPVHIMSLEWYKGLSTESADALICLS